MSGIKNWMRVTALLNIYDFIQYKLHLYETATGLKFVLLTDLNVGNIRDNLQTIYR